MKKIWITGGTGKVGSVVIPRLLEQGNEVYVLTTQPNPKLPSAVNIYSGDLTNASTLQKAFSNADMIIHCASNFLDPENVDVKGSRNMLSVIPKEKLEHLIYISIVGVDKSQYPYYKAKFEVEQMIMKSGVPFTNLRATQFHHFVLHRIIKQFDSNTDNVLQLPENFMFQSVDISDVAEKIIELVGKTPQNKTESIGGPEVLSLEKMTQDYLNFLGRKDKIELVQPEAFKIFQTGINLCPDKIYGKVTWAKYLENNLEKV